MVLASESKDSLKASQDRVQVQSRYGPAVDHSHFSCEVPVKSRFSKSIFTGAGSLESEGAKAIVKQSMALF